MPSNWLMRCMDLSNVFLFPTGAKIPTNVPISEEEVNVIKLSDNLRDAINSGNVRRVMIVMLAPDSNPVYLWCNLDLFSLQIVGDAMKAKCEEITEYLKQHNFDDKSGVSG